MSLQEVPQAQSSERPANWLAGLGTGFRALCAGTFINRAGTMVVPFLTLYLVSARGFSVVAAGEVVAGFGVGAIIAPLIGGALADHVGRRITLLAATLITAAVMVALAYVRSTALIVALVLLLGVGLEAPRPVTHALVADLVAEKDRVRAYAVLFWVGNLGFATAMATAGFAAQSEFVLVFWIDAITGCLFGGLVWRFVSENDRRAARVEPRSGGYRQVLNHRPMVALTFAVMIYYFVYLQSDATLSLAVRDSGLPPHVYGLCMALNGVLIYVAQPVLAPRLMRLDPGRVCGRRTRDRRRRVWVDCRRIDGCRLPAVGRHMDRWGDLSSDRERRDRHTTGPGAPPRPVLRPLRIRPRVRLAHIINRRDQPSSRPVPWLCGEPAPRCVPPRHAACFA